MTAVPVAANGATPTIDGVIGEGEWDAYHLGTSVTEWAGGMSVDVYGFAGNTYLYVAYVVDTSQRGWATACGLCINCNFYYKTPQSAEWPEEGCTLLATGGYPDYVCQTVGSDWQDKGSFATNGIDIAYTDMYVECNNVVELKIPLSLLTYAGADGQIRLSGQYWQYDWATAFFVAVPLPAKADIITMSALISTTRDNMPGMIKEIRAAGFDSTKLKIMVGGAPVTQDFADSIGADGYAPDAGLAVKKAKELLGIA